MENTTKLDVPSLDLNDLLSTMLRHKFAIVLITILMMMGAVFYIKTADKVYYAYSIILLENQNKNIEIETLKNSLAIDALYISSEMQVLKSRELISDVLNRMGVFDAPELLLSEFEEGQNVSNNALIGYVLGKLTVRQIQKSRAIEVGYKSHNNELSSWLVNTLVSLYIKKDMSSEKIDISSTNKWLKERVLQIRESVEKIDKTIVEFKKDSNFIDNNGQNILESKIGQLSQNLVMAQIKLAQAQVRWREINEKNSLKTAPEIIKSGIIQRLIERQALSRDEVFRINKEYGEDHPEMISANSRLQSITKQIEEEVGKIAKSLEREYRMAQANVEEIEAQLDELKSEYNKMNEYNVRLSSLEMEAENRKKLLEKLDARWKEIQIQEGLGVQSPNATILSKATTPTTPQGPSSKIVLLISIIGGVFMGLAFAIILDYMQTNVYNGKQLQKNTGLPNIALIPKLGGSNKSQIQTFVSKLYNEPLSDYAEALRSLTAHLKMSVKNSRSKKIFNFTSVASGDGKSALVAATACQLSLEGLKVLVIDCDLRNPSLGNAFNLQDKKGLSDLLAGSVKLRDIVYKDKKSSIDLIGIGTLHDINIIKKSAKTWKQILERASQDYDIIILDGPPVVNISDMSILAQDSQNILCIRWKKTSLKQIIYSQNVLKSLDFSLLGTVITLVSPKKIKQLNKA